jgi:hypothetical protein
MTKRKAARAETTHSAGTYDDTRQLFLLSKDRINKKRFSHFRNWLAENVPAVEYALENLSGAKRNHRGMVLSSEMETLLRRSRVLRETEGETLYLLQQNIIPYITRHIIWLYRKRQKDAHLNLFILRPLRGDGVKHQCPFCKCKDDAA